MQQHSALTTLPAKRCRGGSGGVSIQPSISATSQAL